LHSAHKAQPATSPWLLSFWIQVLATAFSFFLYLLFSLPLKQTKQHQQHRALFYALSRRNSVTSKLLQTNPLNILHFPANPALLGSLERGLHSPSIKQVRHMIDWGLEGGNPKQSDARRVRASERARSWLQAVRVVLNLYWALQGSNV
jgi:hypothetical protein